jgi:CheY-like chemotaxis protein
MKERYRSPKLLIVEDSDEYFEILSRIIERVSDCAISIDRCIDGDDVLDYLNHQGSYINVSDPNPDLILLDLNLPGTDGREVLATLEQTANLKPIPVVVLTTSANPKDIETCYRFGANSYLLKPMKIEELHNLMKMTLDYWFKATTLPTAFASQSTLEK